MYAVMKTECDAKNRAYVFILESGLLEEFRRWNNSHGKSDAHSRAVEYLATRLQQGSGNSNGS